MKFNGCGDQAPNKLQISGGVCGFSVFHGSEYPFKNFRNRHSQFGSLSQIAEFDALKSLKCCMAYTLV